MANPRHVTEVVATIPDRRPGLPRTRHLRNSRDMGLVNALAACDAGIRGFDSALGGIGGCPCAPGATGNARTEDLVYMCHRCGIPTGTGLWSLIEISQALPDV